MGHSSSSSGFCVLLGGTVVPGAGAFANISRSSWKGVSMGEMYNGDYIDWEERGHTLLVSAI